MKIQRLTYTNFIQQPFVFLPLRFSILPLGFMMWSSSTCEHRLTTPPWTHRHLTQSPRGGPLMASTHWLMPTLFSFRVVLSRSLPRPRSRRPMPSPSVSYLGGSFSMEESSRPTAWLSGDGPLIRSASCSLVPTSAQPTYPRTALSPMLFGFLW